jgi:hypothetical protein
MEGCCESSHIGSCLAGVRSGHGLEVGFRELLCVLYASMSASQVWCFMIHKGEGSWG